MKDAEEKDAEKERRRKRTPTQKDAEKRRRQRRTPTNTEKERRRKKTSGNKRRQAGEKTKSWSGWLAGARFGSILMQILLRRAPAGLRRHPEFRGGGEDRGLRTGLSPELDSKFRTPYWSTELGKYSGLEYGVRSLSPQRTPYWSTIYCIAKLRTDGAGLRIELTIFQTGMPNSAKCFMSLMFAIVLVPYSVPVRSPLRTQTPY